MAYPKQTKEMTLDLSQIPDNRQDQAKQDVGEFIRDEIFRFVSSGRSPVAGRTFDKLDPKYADKYKGGNRTPNLELEGDMLDSLEFELTSRGIEIGIFDSDEQGKADGHNNFSGDSKLPTRRFIPDENEDFNGRIMTGVRQILNQYREDFDPFDLKDLSALALARSVIEPDSISIDDITGDLGGSL
jgi:hypothetical protein